MSTTAPAATRVCPFCAEDIRAAAIVCKHCGRDVTPAAAAVGPPRSLFGHATPAGPAARPAPVSVGAAPAAPPTSAPLTPAHPAAGAPTTGLRRGGWRGAVGLALAVALTVVAGVLYLGYGPLGEAGAPVPALAIAGPLVVPPTVVRVADEDALEVRPEQHVSYAFTVADARPCRVTGRVVGLSGGRRDVRLLLVTEDDYVNWRGGLSATPLLATAQTAAATLDAPLPGPGAYRLVVDNGFSVLTAKVVQLRRVRATCGA